MFSLPHFLVNELNRTVFSKPTNGVWINSCERHCGNELLTIDGMQFPAATAEFLHGKTGKRLRDSCREGSRSA
eukprot:gene16465-5076_t